MPDKLLELKNDVVFQKLFGNPKNKEITGHLLSLILKREINNVDLDANKVMIGRSKNSKVGRLDIRVKFNDGEDCNIELQVRPFRCMENRMLEYWANMYSSKINRGQNYEVLKPSISILIADYKLDKSKEICDMKNDELAQWLKFISDPEDMEVQRIMCENKFYKQAREELASFSGDENFRRLVEARAGFLMDQETEKSVSKEEGKAEEKRQIAQKMKAKNMPIEEIAELTGLTKEEIEKL